jgi:predicted Zn-dependent protease with MMP-like domain
VDLTPEHFDALVSEALDTVPAELMDLLDNVVFLVEDEPAEADAGLLGLYEGIPKTARGVDWGGPILPDRITLFRGPLLRLCRSPEELEDEVAITVVHEVAHHFGIDDERLHELGWG